ncbi:MAG TPA: type II toxin-antitoxin system prevent-host-death family antitoxin [Chloroflexota bacterium]|nr:type II toxin-antitoxin system prevent-host-death family antitoxin [Chloroflexota bacterium]
MNTVGVRELRQNASAVLRRVKAGEILEVTDRGRPIARLVPIKPLSRWDQLVAEGRLIPASESLADNMDKYPMVKLPPGSPTLSDILAEMREDER